MTTTLNAVNETTLNTVNDAAEASTNPAENGTETEAQKKTRVTLISALEAGDAEGVAGVLLRQGRTEAQIKAFSDVMKKAIPSFKVLVQEAEKQAKLEAEQAELRKKEELEATTKAEALAAEAKQQMINTMVESLTKGGVSPEMALKVANSTLGGGSTSRGSAAPKQRIKCKYNGVEYMVAVTGNNKDATKEAITASGKTREEFIEAYKVA